jgi:hypothetical protein
MKSLYNVSVQVPNQTVRSYNVLAETLQTAIDAAMYEAGSDATLAHAFEVGGKPIDLIVPGVEAPAEDLAPRIVYNIQFRVASGPNNTTPAPLVVLSNAQRNNGVTTAAQDVAITAAASYASATPNALNVVGVVEQEG